MKKTMCAVIIGICLAFFMQSIDEQPTKRQKTFHQSSQSDSISFQAADNSLNTAPINIAELSPYIANLVEEKQTIISFAEFGINATTLAYYLDCLKNVMNGIEAQKKFKDFPTSFLLQRKDGEIIAKNALPAISKTIANISNEDFVDLVKLSQFTEVNFLLNALCSIFITKNYSSKSFNDFLNDTNKLLQIFDETPYKLLKKHAYINKVLPWPDTIEPYEMSIGDYVTLYPEQKNKMLSRHGTHLQIIDKLNNADSTTIKHISSLDGIDLLNLESIKNIKIESDFLVPAQYDPFFPENPFENASKVVRLEISNTVLYALPESFLEGLNSLEELNLSSTKLSILSSDFFEPIATTIQEILLQNNKITQLDRNIFNKSSQFLLYQVFLALNPICDKLDDSYFILRPYSDDPNHKYIDCKTINPQM